MRKKVVFFIVCMLVITGFFAIYPIENAKATGIAGCWNLNEGSGIIAYDSSAYSHDGTIYGTTWINGISGKALSFDGLDDFIDIGDIGSFVYTSIIWLKPTNTITKISAPNNLQYFYDNCCPLQLGSGTSLVQDETICLHGLPGDRRTAVIDLPILQDEWHMIALAWNSNANRYDIYYDGFPQVVTTGSSDGHVGLMSCENLKIAWAPDQNYFNGFIDEISIYDEVLTGSQINNMYIDMITQKIEVNFAYEPLNPLKTDIIKFTDKSIDYNGNIIERWWNFGDGYFSNLINPQHCYYHDGTYTVTLTVTNDYGAINSTQKTISITGFDPIADFTYTPLNPSVNEIIQFNDISSDIDGTIVGWFWDFDDGSTSTLQNPTHFYTSVGTYKVNLTVTDDDGKKGYTEKSINVILVNNPPSKPIRPYGYQQLQGNKEYTFHSRSTDPDADNVFYKWDWGDGTTSEWLGPFTSGHHTSASHIWTTRGRHYVKVKTKDIYDAESDWSEPLRIFVHRG